MRKNGNLIIASTETLCDQRADLRMPAADKVVLEKAASLRHTSITSFVVAVALPEARKILSEAESLTLSARDSKHVMA